MPRDHRAPVWLTGGYRGRRSEVKDQARGRRSEKRRMTTRPLCPMSSCHLSSAPPKPHGQHVKLRQVRPACGRLDVLDGCKIALEAGEQFALGAALEHLAQECPAGPQRFAGEQG